ncbi:pantoate--beta-alanine ligase [Gabonibacter chumensis]|uniref:pantoate--beta-alanine ligase n=1 Tax=Gabonibacter chumensis TaxID=2972474 RepID=UPI002573869D|nr:pantoate--beta-alanine ligase [Gabonibacter chumensis]MCR9011169.1 pantoate--beta-alanine ligase [Gabonibacter chumensis]
METIYKKSQLTALIEKLKNEGKKVGFVPTMGALHEGHISLVKTCKRDNDITVVSIFVNPTQFNDKEDLKRYPRTVEKDIVLLEKNGCDYAFVPDVEEIYPEEDTRSFDFGYVETVMEGAKRPGHFNGVGQVVSKLFDIVKPHRAYFGMKDFQQIAIIKNMVKQLHYNLEIIPCPIVRETDGLAMSSRNTLLKPLYRQNAPHIHKILQEATELTGKMNVEELKQWVTSEINKNPYLEVEYFEIVDDTDLRPIKDWNENKNKVGCIAVYADKIRLIDNIVF